MTARVLLPILLSVGALSAADTRGPALDQVGYRCDDPKDFRLARNVSGFKILNERHEVVLTGRLTGPVPDPHAGEEVWRGDFSALKQAGTYVIELDDGTRSLPLRIGDDVYKPLLQVALRGLYVSRCGYLVQDGAVGHPPCHLHDGEAMIFDGKQMSDGRDATGGWHDGGDYWRSTMSAAQAVSRLLWPIELFPGALDNLPSCLRPEERWGDHSDLLTEAHWGLDWLAKMQDEDGGVSTGISPEIFRMPGQVPPQDDPLVQYRGAVNSSHTAKIGAVFARAARILRSYDPVYADTFLERARRCWAYLQAHPRPVLPATIAVYGRKEDESDRLWLAVELFRTTGESAFHRDFLARFRAMDQAYPSAPVDTQTIRNYNLHEALISYCFLGQKADPDVRNRIITGLRAECDRFVKEAAGRGYGCVLTNEYWRQRHTCGNALQIAWELTMAYELTGHRAYRETALAQLHFVLGRNPLGQVFVTGVGENPVRHPHYRPTSIRGETPPGLLVKGPTHDPQFLATNYAGVPIPPPEKAYIDNVSAHQCNEPDIEVQGHLIGLAAYFQASARK